MVAASIWSLLIPAMQESSKMGRFAFPAGFLENEQPFSEITPLVNASNLNLLALFI